MATTPDNKTVVVVTQVPADSATVQDSTPATTVTFSDNKPTITVADASTQVTVAAPATTSVSPTIVNYPVQLSATDTSVVEVITTGPQGPPGINGTNGTVTGAAGGDLSGTYPNPTVLKASGAFTVAGQTTLLATLFPQGISIKPAGVTNPYMSITVGNTTNPGYISWFNTTGLRKAYLGWAADGALDFQVENGTAINAAQTTQTLAAELNSWRFGLGAHTYTANVVNQRGVLFNAPGAYQGDVAGRQITGVAATVSIAGAPTAGANMTIAQAFALWVSSGSVRFDGNFYFNTDVIMNRSAALQLDVNSLFRSMRTLTSDGAFATSITGDTVLRYVVTANGVMAWGDGTANRDTNLYRGGTGILQTDNLFRANRTTSTTAAIATYVVGDTVNRLSISADGKHDWGPGTGAADTNLYRNGASVLFTDSLFRSAQTITSRYNAAGEVAIGGDANGSIELGRITNDPAAQTPFIDFHYAPGGTWTGQDYNVRLINDVDGRLNFATRPQGGSPLSTFTVSQTAGVTFPMALSSTTGLIIGGDTNLYRNSADVLKTDDEFRAGSHIVAAGQFTSNRATAGVTHFAAYVTGDANPKFSILGNPAGGLLQWSDGTLVADTNLYRSGVDTLKTDDALISALGIRSLVNANWSFRGEQGAGGLVLGNVLLSSDANYAFQIRGDGEHRWGPGGATVYDAYLRRAGTLQLQTNAFLQFVRTLATDWIVEGHVSGEAVARYVLRTNGTMTFSDGTNAADITLSRNLPNELMLDTARLLVRRALVTDSALGAILSGDVSSRFILSADGRMAWGPGNATQDTTLYRSAADTLKTDDKFVAGGGLQVPTGAAAGSIMTSDASGNGTWTAPIPWQEGHTFAISGAVAATDRFPGFIVPVRAGTTVKLARLLHRIRSGTSLTFTLNRNGAAVTGLTGLVAGSTQTNTDPADVTLADGDYLEVVPSAIAGAPTDFTATIVLETVLA